MLTQQSDMILNGVLKDFDVGKKYKKKITLTNICTITNQCKLLGVSSQLKDFISIK